MTHYVITRENSPLHLLSCRMFSCHLLCVNWALMLQLTFQWINSVTQTSPVVFVIEYNGKQAQYSKYVTTCHQRISNTTKLHYLRTSWVPNRLKLMRCKSSQLV